MLESVLGTEASTVDEEELLDELYDTLTNLCHHYEGMKRELAKGDYTAEQAERDWTALTYNEGMNVLPILADMFQKVKEP